MLNYGKGIKDTIVCVALQTNVEYVENNIKKEGDV